jgi:uncharacterized membrane protein
VSLIIQFSILISSPRLGNLTLDLSDVTIQFFRNYGYYAIAWVDGVASDFLAVAGIAVLASLVFIIRESDVLKDRDIAFILKATLFASIVFTLSTSVIVPLQTSPGLNGPRYYFLTFVLISFILLISTAVKTENLTQNRLVISSASMILIAMSLLTLSVNWNRFHVEINWPDEVRAACTRNFQDRQVPIHFDGNTETTWKMRLTKSTCDNL